MLRPTRRALLGLTGLAALSSSVGSCSDVRGQGRGEATEPVAQTPADETTANGAAAAVRAGDRGAYIAGVGASTPAEQARAASVFETLIALGGRYDVRTGPGGEQLERVRLALPSSLGLSWTFTLSNSSGGVIIAPQAAFWRSEHPLTVARTAHALVLAPTDVTPTLAPLVEAAERRVLARWPDPPERAGLAVVVARDAASLGAWAAPGPAVATSVRIDRAGPMTTVLGPTVPRAAGQVPASVITHEAVHVIGDLCARAAGATGDLAPRWLREGLAEHLSAAGLGLTSALVGSAEASVRADRQPIPVGYPDERAFAGTGADRAYDLSWLAVDVLVGLVGSDRVVDWYRRWSVPGRTAGRWPAGIDRVTAVRGYRDRLTEWRR